MELLSFQSFLLVIVFPLFIYVILYGRRRSSGKGGFKSYPIVGHLPGFWMNQHRFLDWTTQVLMDCPTNTAVVHHPWNVNGVITADPLNVEHMLKTNFQNYTQGESFLEHFHDVLGQGIFTSNGDSWKSQRKIASYQFSTKSLRNFNTNNIKTEMLTKLIPFLTNSARAEHIFDLQDVFGRFGFDTICKFAFNVDPGVLEGHLTSGSTSGYEFLRALEQSFLLSAYRSSLMVPFLWRIKKFFNIGSERVLKSLIKDASKFADDIIQSRIEARTSGIKSDEDDLLSRFMGEEVKSPEYLRDVILSFILAGRETMSSALGWFFWLVTLHPKVEQRILEELQTIRSRYGKTLGDTYEIEELREMHYLHAAISESLRLYPPTAVDTKMSQNDDVLPDGTFVGKGWFISCHTYAIGRTESIWGKNCHLFVPERWLENGIFRQENPFKYPVFNAGPRMCLGKDLAYIQMKSLAATIIERFVVEISDKHKSPEPMLSSTLHIKGGLWVKVKERYAGLVIP